MSTLKTGLPYIGLQANWQQIITGIILLAAVGIDVVKNNRK
jgi:ribose transport system permease protein